ncbi:TonB-dependent receptor [Parabacteroides sp. PF5-9]|uniref:TonB-dependent receptor n=1 Tax=Parabacteroides sp. PF5-9 TaxID=1742404 RepID=UPI002474B816|nr:TonB-dependent receptor [Parabacteroides sp. PF5-9]MDH6356919.1 outer membrane receptor protein involved in Fe transport [Parabacteroides sp. PF5-9]
MRSVYRIIGLFLLLTTHLSGQNITGYIYDESTQEILPGVNVYYKNPSGMHGTVSDANGFYELAVPNEEVTLTFSFLGYQTQTIPFAVAQNQHRSFNIYLKQQTNLMDEVVVSVGRYEQKLSDITVSMELLKPSDINKQMVTDLSGALAKVSGVDITDRQPSIRGGSGWTYGVGSRSLIMVDGMSVLTPGSGEINWNVVPMENAEQIEVIKGASSVLYGSSALNGLINVRTKRPGLEPVTRITTSLGIYGNPENSDYIWWDRSFWKDGKYPVEGLFRRNILSGIRNPIYNNVELSHTRRINDLDVSAGINYFTDEGYRSGNYTKRFRINGNITYHDPRVHGLNYGLNANFLSNDYAGFFIWRSADEPYKQSPLANMGRQANNFFIDPFLNYTNEEKRTTHRFKSRIYHQGNQIVSTPTNKSIVDIANNMGFDYNSIPEITDLVTNWQSELLPLVVPHLPEVLNGDVNGLMNEVKQLGNRFFPSATSADYMDLISWVMGNTPLPTSSDDVLPWLINSMTPKEKENPGTDKTTSYYLDYQFTKNFDHSRITTGATYEHIHANSNVTGVHNSDNIALFAQYDHKFFDKLNVSAGMRLEYYRINDNYREAETSIFGIDAPFKPVFRGGLNYELAEYSYLRASIGQGYRYPSVTEKYILKDIGGVGAFPNHNLKAERGYNAELGIKQGYQIGNLKGFLDGAVFYTRYKDMIEFRFGLFDKQTFDYMESLPDLIRMITSGNGIGIGAQFTNVGRAEIYGVDLSANGIYDFNPDTRFTFNLGYVYTEPRDMDIDELNAKEDANNDLLAMKSKSNNNKYLKYRQKHTIKGIVDFEWKRFSVGANMTWKSKTLAVDYFMVDERDKPQQDLMDYMRSMLFGDLHNYWTKNNDGYFTMDLRMGFKLSKQLTFQAMINNVLNTEYTLRPMDVAPPRTFIFQIAASF